MKRVLAALVVALGLFAFHGIAAAQCVTNGFTDASGRYRVCTTCCYGTVCNTTCS